VAPCVICRGIFQRSIVVTFIGFSGTCEYFTVFLSALDKLKISLNVANVEAKKRRCCY
jgi:hypothetical protein